MTEIKTTTELWGVLNQSLKKDLPRKERYKIIDKIFETEGDIDKYYLSINNQMSNIIANISKKEKKDFYGRVFSPFDFAADYLCVCKDIDNGDQKYQYDTSKTGETIFLYDEKGLSQKYRDRSRSRLFNVYNFSEVMPQHGDFDMSALDWIESQSVEGVKIPKSAEQGNIKYFDSQGNVISESEVHSRRLNGEIVSFIKSSKLEDKFKRIPDQKTLLDEVIDKCESDDFSKKLDSLTGMDAEIVNLTLAGLSHTKIEKMLGLTKNQLQVRLHCIGELVSSDKYYEKLPKTKKCGICGKVKSFAEFDRDRTNLDSLHAYCKDCRKIKNKKLVS